jgi:transcriptional regulator
MYNYPHYKETDRSIVAAFMRKHSFITLIGSDLSGRLAVTQVPVLVEEREGKFYLYGHIANKSDHHKALLENPMALALFTGPHAYVSATWYTNPHMGSTWNYASVHARGNIRFLDEAGLINVLKKLSLHFENGDTGSATYYDNLPDEYTSKMIKAIVAFELEVTELDNVFKLSQNRDEQSYDRIIAKLNEQDDSDAKKIAAMMKERKSKVFS